jgi:hypothetical protein
MRATRGERLVVAAVAAAAAALGLLIARFVLDLVPHVTDSVSYLFQGRILASGHLYLPPPPLAPLFGHENVLLTASRWCSIYPPGWPLLLALGWLAHAPWLASPLLLGLAVVGVWLAGRRLYDPATGVVAAAALACSPFALLMAGDAMAHVPALCAAVWCLAELAAGVAGEGGKRRGHLAAAGLLAGFAALIRPATAAALLAPAMAWCALALARRRRIADLGWIALGALPPLAALAAYDTAVFGGPLTSGYAVYEPQRFAGAAGALAPAGAALLRHLPWYLRHLNGCLWGFPWGDLATLTPLLWARPRRAADAMLAACALCLILAHSFYYYGDIIYSGPRFAFESLGPLALLAARSLLVLRASVAWALDRPARGWAPAPPIRVPGRDPAPPIRVPGRDPAPPIRVPGRDPAPPIKPRLSPAGRRAVRLALSAAAVCLLLYFPLGRRLPAQMLHHAQWYLAQAAAPLQSAARAGVGPEALVLVGGTPYCYSSFFLANALHPRDAPRVYVRDVPPWRGATMRAYPRAQVWLVRVVVAIPPSQPDVARFEELSWQRLR